MSTPEFDKAFEVIIGHEGGYVNHPNDPGGETKFGISKRAYPNVDIKNLTLEGAKAIYERDYWQAIQGDKLPYGIAVQVFDAAVNHGVRQAVLFMQRALKVDDDGVLGPKTIAAAWNMDEEVFRARFNAQRLRFFTNLNDVQWSTFGKGWVRRVASNLESA